MAKVSEFERDAAILRDTALGYPETHEDHPWGETAIKVRGKAFLFMRAGETLSLSCKLPASHEMALMLPFARSTGYGLGKSGWVSASFAAGERPPIELLRAWIDESFRAIAPKRLSAGLVDGAAKKGVEGAAVKRAAKKVGEERTVVGGKKAAKKAGGGKRAAAKAGGAKTAMKRASGGEKAGGRRP